MSTALQEHLRLDTGRMRARQWATMLVHELASGGYIPSACQSDAASYLASLLHNQGVEITTADDRRAAQVAKDALPLR